jgi:type II secretion system protein N
VAAPARSLASLGPVRALVPRTRRGRIVAGVAAYLALTLAFVAAGFPYDRFAPRVADVLGAVTGTHATVGRVGAGLWWIVNPQLLLWDVDLKAADGRQFHFDRIRVRAAWSTSWLHREPSFVVALRSHAGDLDGTVRIGSQPGFSGRLSKVVLDRIPFDAVAAGLQLTGRLDADVQLRNGAGGPRGNVALHARNGSVSLPDLPIGIPFERMDADLALDDQNLVTVHSLSVDGPLAALQASGTVGRAPVAASAPLALQVHLEAREPALREVLAGEGVAVGANGVADLAVGGTLSSPVLRSGGAQRPPARRR